MAIATTATRRTHADPGPAFSVRRLAALAPSKFLVLMRDPLALFSSLLMPPALAALVLAQAGEEHRDTLAAIVVPTLVATSLLMGVYVVLTTWCVEWRESGVLKRMLTGRTTRAELLTSMSVPSVVTLVGQVVLSFVVLQVFDVRLDLTNPVLAAVGVLGGLALCVLLGAATSGVTKTASGSQITTLPIALAGLFLSGTMGHVPEVFAPVAPFTPLYPVVELVRIGLSGLTADSLANDGAVLTFAESWGAAGRSVAVLAAWILVAALASRWLMRWLPRR